MTADLDSWRRRFADFVARREHEARAAAIPPFVTDFDRGSRDLIAIANEWTHRLFDGPFYASPPDAELPSTCLVFVQSREGNTVAADPSSLGGGEADRHLLYEGLSRVAADAVMAGAETVRGGRVVLSTWHPELTALRATLGLPRHPIQIVATLGGIDFGGILFNVPEIPVVLLTVLPCASRMARELELRPWVEPVVMSSGSDLVSGFRQLRQRGIRRVSCIGGRTIAGRLIESELAQDLYLTTSPRSGGEPDTPLYAGRIPGELIVRKRGTGPDTGVVFEHFRLYGHR